MAKTNFDDKTDFAAGNVLTAAELDTVQDGIQLEFEDRTAGASKALPYCVGAALTPTIVGTTLAFNGSAEAYSGSGKRYEAPDAYGFSAYGANWYYVGIDDSAQGMAHSAAAPFSAPDIDVGYVYWSGAALSGLTDRRNTVPVSMDLDDLQDVDAASPTNLDVLQWINANSAWEPQPLSSVNHDSLGNLEWSAAGHTIDATLQPDGDATRDLGASGGRWADAYADQLVLGSGALDANAMVKGAWSKSSPAAQYGVRQTTSNAGAGTSYGADLQGTTTNTGGNAHGVDGWANYTNASNGSGTVIGGNFGTTDSLAGNPDKAMGIRADVGDAVTAAWAAYLAGKVQIGDGSENNQDGALTIDPNAGGTDQGFATIRELSAGPGNGAANTARIYAIDNGGGKTQLMVVFASGAAQQIAIEP